MCTALSQGNYHESCAIFSFLFGINWTTAIYFWYQYILRWKIRTWSMCVNLMRKLVGDSKLFVQIFWWAPLGYWCESICNIVDGRCTANCLNCWNALLVMPHLISNLLDYDLCRPCLYEVVWALVVLLKTTDSTIDFSECSHVIECFGLSFIYK